jgi:excisionase family DNA binding protein
VNEEAMDILREAFAGKVVDAIVAVVHDVLDGRARAESAVTFVDTAAAAELLNISAAAVRERARRGSLTAYRIGSRLFFDRDEVLRICPKSATIRGTESGPALRKQPGP